MKLTLSIAIGLLSVNVLADELVVPVNESPTRLLVADADAVYGAPFGKDSPTRTNTSAASNAGLDTRTHEIANIFFDESQTLDSPVTAADQPISASASCSRCEQSIRCCCVPSSENGGLQVGGWFSTGYHSESNGLFNNNDDELSLHQGWLFAERAATSEHPVGFRMDVMYGIDAADTQAFGNDGQTWDFQNGFDHGIYGWAIPQLYLEVAAGEWRIQAGHFYTLVGYEVVTAPDNFFYSHAMTMVNSEPFTHTGVLASRPVGDRWELFAGWTLGWDTGFNQANSGSSWLGGARVSIGSDASLTYMSTAGNFGARGRDAYAHSIVFDMEVTSKLNWVVQSDLLRIRSTGEDNVGINQYFLYRVNDCVGIGSRLEWWKADNVTAFAPHQAALPSDGSFSYYAATIGANLRLCDDLLVRPEIRFDWSPAANYDETYFGIDAIVTF